jgi:glycosyltransferase involved in cell wall biosynthesis
MPVYNGERYLEEALQSVLSQSYEDLEVVIADNASTDGTEEVCRTYARSDERIRYFRMRQNYGVIDNFNNVFRLSTGEYFKWAASDDVCGPDYLLEAVNVLESDPSVVLAWATPVGIDEQGERVSMPFEVSDLNSPNSAYSPDPTVRFRRLLRNIWWTDGPFYGVIRAATLAETRRLVPHHMSSDHILLTELSLKGRFYEIPGELFFSRVHSGKTSRQHRTLRERATLIDQQSPGKGVVGWWRMLRGYPQRIVMYTRFIVDSSLSPRQKLICQKEVLRAVASWGVLRMRQLMSGESPWGPEPS